MVAVKQPKPSNRSSASSVCVVCACLQVPNPPRLLGSAAAEAGRHQRRSSTAGCMCASFVLLHEPIAAAAAVRPAALGCLLIVQEQQGSGIPKGQRCCVAVTHMRQYKHLNSVTDRVAAAAVQVLQLDGQCTEHLGTQTSSRCSSRAHSTALPHAGSAPRPTTCPSTCQPGAAGLVWGSGQLLGRPVLLSVWWPAGCMLLVVVLLLLSGVACCGAADLVESG